MNDDVNIEIIVFDIEIKSNKYQYLTMVVHIHRWCEYKPTSYEEYETVRTVQTLMIY